MPESGFTEVPDRATLPRLSVAACELLAAEVRRFLIESVTRTGGHLGANLSTVELTIALRRAFGASDTPIIWDTGHQSYTHKILTGRLRDFGSLRSRHGLSGFPSRVESPEDLVENSHTSVGPAWAHGVAAATGRRSVVVIGDGAMTGGVAFEALNAIGHRRSPVVVVLNDNGRSYAPTPSNLTYGEPISGPGRTTPRGFFEALGLAYRGPVAGHDIAELDEAFAWTAQQAGPCVVHVRTQKGKGWPSAIDDGDKRLHDVGPNYVRPRPAARDPEAVPADWSSLVGRALCDLAAVDPRVHAITAAMAGTLGLADFQAQFPARFHDLGIAEQACVATAAGLASQGMRPFFPVVTTFLTRALDQVLYDVALHRLPVVFLLDRAGVTGPDGPSHHGMFDVGLLRNVPHLEIYAPWTAADLDELLKECLSREHGPIVVRYSKDRPAECSQADTASDGLIRHGDDICLVAYGSTTTPALEAAQTLLEHDGIDCDVWRLSRIHPLDPGLIKHAAQARLVVTVEEVSASGGMAAEVAYQIMRQYGRAVPVEPLTLPGDFLPHGSRADLLAESGLTAEAIAASVRTLAALR